MEMEISISFLCNGIGKVSHGEGSIVIIRESMHFLYKVKIAFSNPSIFNCQVPQPVEVADVQCYLPMKN